MARIVRFHEVGSPDVLCVEDVQVRQPGPGELRIRVDAIGLNRAEILFRYGHHPTRPNLPSMIGSEAAGTVESVGAGVTGFAVGDPVSVIPRVTADYGTCGELINIPARYVAGYPSELTPVEAAGLWMAYLTAFGLAEAGDLGSGDIVLLPAASGSVGIAAMQIANMMGAKPIAVTRGRLKVQKLQDAGAAEVIVSGEENVAERVMDITNGKGARLILDPIGGSAVDMFAPAIAQKGTYIVYGALSFDPTPFPVALAFARDIMMKTYALDPSRQNLERSKQFICTGIEQGVLRPVIDTTFALADIAKAYRYMEANTQFGKIVVTPG